MANMALFASGPTPGTPEILNSLVSMTNPLDVALKHASANNTLHTMGPQQQQPSCCNGLQPSSCLHGHHQTSSQVNRVPPLHHTRSQLIKEGLKLQLQSRRRNASSSTSSTSSTGGSLTLVTTPVESPPPTSPMSHSRFSDDLTPPSSDSLTPEDEERRRRRRERNKIAATKCRLKKREKTFNLVHESEILETQNMDLKSQIQDLENEKRRLVDMLSVHGPNCSKASTSSYQPATSSPYSEAATSSASYNCTQSYQEKQSSSCSRVEISCETTISYRTKQDGSEIMDVGRRTNSIWPEAKDYCQQQLDVHHHHQSQYPEFFELAGHYHMAAPGSVSSSESALDSPLAGRGHYHNLDDEPDSPYIPMFPMSTQS